MSRRKNTIRRYTDLDEVGQSPLRPTGKELDLLSEQVKDLAIKEASLLLMEQFGGNRESETDTKTDPLAADKELCSSSELVSEFDIDPDRPIGLVMTQVFVEPTTMERSLFPDYLTWFRWTVDHVSDVDSANWLVKPHPHAPRYNCRQTVEEELDQLGESSVVLLPRNLDNGCLVDIADIVVTMNGTAGLEFPCFGIPAVVASDSNYTGFGFTYEPETRADYLESLLNIDQIEPLDRQEVDTAKLVYYAQYFLMSVGDVFVPESVDERSKSGREYWTLVADRVEGADPGSTDTYQKVREFVSSEYDHLLNWELLGS